MYEYTETELHAPIYALEGYELRQVVGEETFAIFRNYSDESGATWFYSVNDDWGLGNIDDEGLFVHRVVRLQDDMRCLMAEEF